MEENKNIDRWIKTIPLKEKIHGFGIYRKKVKQGFFCEEDVETSLQNLKEELNEVILFAPVLIGDDIFQLSEKLDKAFKKHIGELE